MMHATNRRADPRAGSDSARRDAAGTGAPQPARRKQAERGDLYAEVTRRIIADLESGCVPWVQPWDARGCAPCLPRNALSQRVYSGINVLILWSEATKRGFAAQRWLTFKQAQGAGGGVRKGEHGATIFYADSFTPKQSGDGRAENEQEAREGDAPRVYFLKRFTVFNVAQCEGLADTLAPEPVALSRCEAVAVGEALIAASGVDFRIGGNEAFYCPGEDFVAVPPQSAFFDSINYYRTALHELTHATGHAARLDRHLVTAFGAKDYAREELVAEMGSAFLCAALGIVPSVRHADYIGNWLQVLREDLSDDPAVRGTAGPRGRAIVRAASAASKAADWLLTRHRAASGDDAGAGA
jgi:antirestriction protein ArdC